MLYYGGRIVIISIWFYITGYFFKGIYNRKVNKYNRTMIELITCQRGGYIISSSNTLILYCKDENVKEMINTFEEFR